MTKDVIYRVPQDIKESALLKKEAYEKLYDESIANPDEFWAKQARLNLDWISEWETVSESNFVEGKVSWFKGAKINTTINCIDRHLENNGNKTAIIWEPNDPSEPSIHLTYQELYEETCKFSNALRLKGIKKGDRVIIYMPMVPEAAIAMLACARLGAIHSVVFGGFSPDALRDRILDSECKLVITSDEGVRGGKSIPLKANVDIATKECDCVEHIVVVKRTDGEVTG